MPSRPAASARARAKSDPPNPRARDAGFVVDALRRLFRAVQEYSKAVQSRTGLSSPQLWALQIVDAHPGLSIGELSERMFVHPSTVSGVVDRLERRRALRRQVDERDRRGVRLSLTVVGRTLLRKSPPPVQSGLARALERMPRAQLAQLRRALEHVLNHTEAARLDAPFFE